MSELGQSIARALAARGVAGVQVDVPLARLTSFRIGGPAAAVAAVEDADFSCIFLEGEDIYINRMDEKSRQFFRDLSVETPPVRPASVPAKT